MTEITHDLTCQKCGKTATKYQQLEFGDILADGSFDAEEFDGASAETYCQDCFENLGNQTEEVLLKLKEEIAARRHRDIIRTLLLNRKILTGDEELEDIALQSEEDFEEDFIVDLLDELIQQNR